MTRKTAAYWLLLPFTAAALSLALVPEAVFADRDERGYHDRDDEWTEEMEEEWGEGEFGEFAGEVELYRELLGLVIDFSEIASDPVRSAVAAVMSIEEHVEADPAALIQFLEKQLAEVKDPAVQRAIHMKLAEFYAWEDEPGKALENLERLIQNKPGPVAYTGEYDGIGSHDEDDD